LMVRLRLHSPDNLKLNIKFCPEDWIPIPTHTKAREGSGNSPF